MVEPSKRPHQSRPWAVSGRSIRRRVEDDIDEVMRTWVRPQTSEVPSAIVEHPPKEASISRPESPRDPLGQTESLEFPEDVSILEPSPSEVDNQHLLLDNELEDAHQDLGMIRFDYDVCINCRCVSCEVCVHAEEGECVHCENCCLSDEEFESADESFSGSGDKYGSDDETCDELCDESKEILTDFTNLAISENLNHRQIESLLKFYRKWSFGKFPLNARTLLKTPTSYELRQVSPDQYWHRGITKDLNEYVSETNSQKVKIKLSVDGLPLARSSGSCFWPILYSFNDSVNVVLAGVYYGNEKLIDSDDFLKDFVEELEYLSVSGIQNNGKSVRVYLSCVVCDAPAKSFIMNTKAHNAYYGCTKCTTKGKMYGRRISYQEINAPLRTDDSFRNQQQAEHHKGATSLLRLPHFCPVSSVSLEYLHLVLLGIVRKIMYMWVSGPLKVRASKRMLDLISKLMTSLVSWTPTEFVRKPRSLQYIKRFKATEYRQILFYTGPVVFQDIIRPDIYEHFLILHAALYILAHPQLVSQYSEYADELLRFGVKRFSILYGKEFVSHNVHGLIHVVDDVKNFGPLDNYSAFMFENFLQKLKKMMRKGDKPLAQLIRRYMEAEQRGLWKKKSENFSRNEPQYFHLHSKGPLCPDNSGPQYLKCKISLGLTFHCKDEANRCCGMKDGSIVLVDNFAYSAQKKCVVAIGKSFMVHTDLYEYPLKSSHLGIYFVDKLHRSRQSWLVSDIRCKYFRMLHKDGYAVVPLLHHD